MRRTEAAAFTLIELLIVILVIALLTGILVPGLNSARATARSAVCKSNLHQWGVALWLYMDQHNAYIPRRGQGIQPLAVIDRPSDWFNCLPPYVAVRPYGDLVKAGCRPRPGEQSLFICPTATDPGGMYFLPYAMNMYLSPWIRPAPHKLADLPHPSQLVFMGDGPGPYSATLPSSQPYGLAARHQGMANLVFVDGHVRAFSGGYLGCGVGDPHRSDVQWETDSPGINQPPLQ